MIHFKLPFFIVATLLTLVAHAGDGAELYRQNCNACHGVDGKGGVGIPLALASFINNVDDDYLNKTIQFGRPGRVMPAFPFLDEKQRSAIIRHMRSWTGKTVRPFDQARIHGDKNRGKELFSKHCASCHGDHGQGGAGTGVTFSRPREAPIIAAALNNNGFLASASDALVKRTIVNGRRGTPMPSAKALGLGGKQINDIVAFIRSWEKPVEQRKVIVSNEPPLIIRESPHDLDTTLKNLKNAVAGANLRLIRVQKLEQGLFPEKDVDPDKVVVYSCGFNFLNEAMKIDPRVGLFLPCRVTVMKVDNKVRLVSINPKKLARVFNNEELDALCDRMHDIYVNMMEEATF